MAQATCPFGTRRSRRWLPWASIALPGAGWLLFGLFPSAATVFYSFTRYSGLPGTPLNVCGLCNYRAAFTSLGTEVLNSIRISLEYTVVVTVVQNGIGLALALLLNRKGRSYSTYRALIFMPEVFSVAIVGAIFSLILDPISGPVPQILQSVFGITSSYLGSQHLALPLVMAVNIWMFIGYSMIIWIAGLRNIPTDVYEAAALDGAGKWRSFWHVTWPLLAPATTVNLFLTTMGTLGEYALVLVMTNGNHGTNTLGMYMFNSAFGPNSRLGYGSMIAMLQFGLTFLIGGVLLWRLRRREVSL